MPRRMTAWALGQTGVTAAHPSRAGCGRPRDCDVRGLARSGHRRPRRGRPGLFPPTSLAPLVALLLATLLFLVLHPALDRHDRRLALVGVDDVDVVQFR